MNRADFLRGLAVTPAALISPPETDEVEWHDPDLLTHFVRVRRGEVPSFIQVAPNGYAFGRRRNPEPCPNCEAAPRKETPPYVYWYRNGMPDHLPGESPFRRWCLCGYAEEPLPGGEDSWRRRV